MKKILLTLFLLIASHSSFSQNAVFGIAIGPENGMALPKFGVEFLKEKEKYTLFYNLEGSAWIFFTLFYSASNSFGIEYKKISFEQSIGFWRYPRIDDYDFGPFRHFTYTPKLGYRIQNVCLKIGPSFRFLEKYSEPVDDWGLLNITKINNVHFNFEILFSIR